MGQFTLLCRGMNALASIELEDADPTFSADDRAMQLVLRTC